MTKFYVTCRAIWGKFSIGKDDLVATSRHYDNRHGQEALWRLAAFYPVRATS